MSHTNSTTNYGLPQWIGSDKPTFLGDFNSAFNTIDGQMKQNSTDAGQAISTANSANATAIDAAERSITAKSTADTAKDTADAANALATTASNTATVAKNTADEAARTAEANNIGNLAPAYDPTLTYNVGDLVTYIDENNSGKLYKCIVAWETPGEFNINYWDDVTVSEEFAHNYTLKGSWTPTGNTTIREFLKDTLYPAVLALCPLGTDEAHGWDNFDASDLILGVMQANGMIQKFSLTIHQGYPTTTPPVFAFTSMGLSSPEHPSDPNDQIYHINIGQGVIDNTYEAFRFHHTVISDPGDYSQVDQAISSIDVRSYTFTKPAGTRTFNLYQRNK